MDAQDRGRRNVVSQSIAAVDEEACSRSSSRAAGVRGTVAASATSRDAMAAMGPPGLADDMMGVRDVAVVERCYTATARSI